ncbi:hypothetical protein T11_2866 [Trichinella zimbabwensis]|uniref:Uncharacterized protein n=1 Tax=Trichinella zimbabwensis TaxID=268475 RepID=A0A0V1HM75_9BILA|nr:hypothetical protein T11_2866 [Trichinella zimbabwensis]
MIEKFSYLCSHLTGNAAAVIEGLPLNAANFEAAMSILVDSFGNKEIIIEEHMKQLQKLPVVTSQWDSTRLRQLINQMEVHVRRVKALGTLPETYQAFLMPMILPRLQQEPTVRWKRGRANGKDSVNDLLSFLKTEMSSREGCRTYDSSLRVASDVRPAFRGKKATDGRRYTTAALHDSIKPACTI